MDLGLLSKKNCGKNAQKTIKVRSILSEYKIDSTNLLSSGADREVMVAEVASSVSLRSLFKFEI